MLRPYVFLTVLRPPEKPNPEPSLRSGLARSGQVAVDTCAAIYFPYLTHECRTFRSCDDAHGVGALSENRPAELTECCRWSAGEGIFNP